MAYNEDADRYCPHCGGKRFITDTHTHDYGYSARSVSRCWDCAPAVEPEAPYVGPDALMDAALARMGMTSSEWSAALFAEFGGYK
jgi:hypothetical protein